MLHVKLYHLSTKERETIAVSGKILFSKDHNLKRLAKKPLIRIEGVYC